MKNLFLAAVAATAVVSFGYALPGDELTADEKAVQAAIEDYVLGFYDAAPERLERSVSPALKKMGYWREDENSEYQGAMHMDFEAAIELAKVWNADGNRGTDLPYAIELHEVADMTATAKVTAYWGQDYFQLAKDKDGRWRIHHVMWQSAPPTR